MRRIEEREIHPRIRVNASNCGCSRPILQFENRSGPVQESLELEHHLYLVVRATGAVSLVASDRLVVRATGAVSLVASDRRRLSYRSSPSLALVRSRVRVHPLWLLFLPTGRLHLQRSARCHTASSYRSTVASLHTRFWIHPRVHLSFIAVSEIVPTFVVGAFVLLPIVCDVTARKSCCTHLDFSE
jgi:hypothetical protein